MWEPAWDQNQVPHTQTSSWQETIDKIVWDIARKCGENGKIPLKYIKRFLDDILSHHRCFQQPI